jgi:hypothetical protein
MNKRPILVLQGWVMNSRGLISINPLFFIERQDDNGTGHGIPWYLILVGSFQGGDGDQGYENRTVGAGSEPAPT